ncbi:MAG: hypothetical protein ACI4T2_01465 [Christensenellales bacterium]
MAKKAKKKSGMKGIILSVLAIVFGALLFCSMFMPMIASKSSDETKVSTVNVLTAMSFADPVEDSIQNMKDLANASQEEIAAYGLVVSEDTAAKTKAAAILNVIASALGGLLVVAAVLAMIFKGKLMRMLVLAFGMLGTLFAIGSIICVFVLLGTEVLGTKFSETAGIHAAPFIAIISGAVATACACLNK